MGELLRDAAARGDSDQVVKLLGEGLKPSYDEVGPSPDRERSPDSGPVVTGTWTPVALTSHRSLPFSAPFAPHVKRPPTLAAVSYISKLNACRRKEQFPFGESMWDPVPCHIQEILYRVVHDCYKRCYCAGGRNALHIAASSGHADVVAALVLSRWDVNAQDAAGYTPIQRAAAEGHLEVVKQLIKHGANVNVQDKVHGNTALHEASWKGYSKCVQALCEANKVNLQIKNFGGFAPLHLACQNGHNQSCRELLMANCNPNIQNNYGDTPLHTSARYGHAGVTRILISADCHMSDQNKNGDTALHITAAMGRRKLTRILLEAGCDPNRRNKQSERARDIAIRKDLSEIVEIIDKTVPLKQKDRHKERKENEKKRGKNESGSSKESSTRPKDKKKHKNEHHAHFGKVLDPKWSPYGCHYYPDPQTFPKPKLDSLPQEPLKKGEQYYLDLAGNIRKGPVGVGYTCYCAPFFRHMEERLDRDKKELKEHIDAAHIRLDKKVSNLENKSRGQLNEITRSMALERFKCQQRHLHLEQWLIRGTIFRNSEKVRTSGASPTLLPKSRSLENILEEKTPSGYNHRSVEMLCDRFKSNKDPIILGDDLKNRSSSREGKESGKGSSEVVGIGTSEGEEDFDRERLKEVQQDRLTNRMNETENQERKLRRSTREMSERIDDILKNADNADNVDGLYDEMMNWRSYHNYLNKRRSGMCFGEEQNGIERNTANRSSHHNLLKEDGSPTGERRIRRLSDPRGTIEEPERKSVQEIVAKLQKQQTVQELVAKIQRKTGLIHKSAQKWKENKSKNKENCPGGHYSDSKKKEYPGSEEMPQDASVTPNYENVRRWDVPQESLSQLPYGCRSGIYSSAKDPDEYQRNLYMLDPDPPNGKGLIEQDFARQMYNPREEVYFGMSENYPGKSYHDIGPDTQVDSGLYKMSHERHFVDHGRLDMVQRGMRNTLDQPHPSYSPTQNDSGYSTKPYGGSSTGPSPSLSGQEYEAGSTEMKLPPPFPGRKRMDPPSSSLV